MPSATLPTITARELSERLAAGGTSVLDVRTPGEYAAAAIDGSQHLPLDQLGDHLDALGSSLAGPVTLVCRSGQRATAAYKKLSAAGATELTVLDGGLTAWQAAGEPVRSAGAGAAPGKWEMERQVRLTAGSLVLAGVIASLRWPKARFLSGAVGGGLAVAALSNTCVMSKVLLLLPYNRADSVDASRAVTALTAQAR